MGLNIKSITKGNVRKRMLYGNLPKHMVLKMRLSYEIL